MDQAIRVYVPLKRHEVEQLMAIASAERRRPADQAAYIVGQYLKTRPTEQQPAELLPA